MKLFQTVLAFCISIPLMAQSMVSEYIPFFIIPGDSMSGIPSWLMIDGELLGENLPDEIAVLAGPPGKAEESIYYTTLRVLGRNTQNEVVMIPDTSVMLETLPSSWQYFTVLNTELPYTEDEHWLFNHLRSGILYIDREKSEVMADYRSLLSRDHPGINRLLDQQLMDILKEDRTGDYGDMVITTGWFEGYTLRKAAQEMDPGLWTLYAGYRQEHTSLEVVWLPDDLLKWLLEGAPASTEQWANYLLWKNDDKRVAAHPGIAGEALWSYVLRRMGDDMAPETREPLRKLAGQLLETMEKEGRITPSDSRRTRLYLDALVNNRNGKITKAVKMLQKVTAGNDKSQGSDMLSAQSYLLLLDIYNQNGEPLRIISLVQSLPAVAGLPTDRIRLNDILILETAGDLATENGYYNDALRFYSLANAHLEYMGGFSQQSRIAYNYGMMAGIALKTYNSQAAQEYLRIQYELMEEEETE